MTKKLKALYISAIVLGALVILTPIVFIVLLFLSPSVYDLEKTGITGYVRKISDIEGWGIETKVGFVPFPEIMINIQNLPEEFKKENIHIRCDTFYVHDVTGVSAWSVYGNVDKCRLAE